ncbi:uncharacterized protein LOC141651755 [Silene latifolia]|uniref:uncharacterized protein LOC141651755 n=1 Tax=Silene latifolia TaxID=37657 RepID=UPI003D7819EE
MSKLSLGGKAEYAKAPNVGWDTCCRPKTEGGLGLKDSCSWNVALLGKYVWWLASKKDHMWVKWVNHVYMKGQHWSDYKVPPDCSWSWRKITFILQKFKQAYVNDKWLNSGLPYTVKAGYEWVRGVCAAVPWCHLVWNNLNLPKTSFIGWAIMHHRLLTKDRLLRRDLNVDPLCEICRVCAEDHQHLFMDCPYFLYCFNLLLASMRLSVQPANVAHWFSNARNVTKLQKRVFGAAYVALLYQIWMCRNEARVSFFLKRPETVVQQVIKDIKLRFQRLNMNKLSQRDSSWILIL